MRPTLLTGDVLHVAPYGDRPLRRGDVIAAVSSGSELPIAHRIIAIDGDAVMVKGDNNVTVDSLVINRSDVMGKVTHAERRGVIRPVHGGMAGRGVARLAAARSNVRRMIGGLAAVAYHRLSCSGALYGLGSLLIRPKAARFMKDGKPEYKLFYGSYLIGRYKAEEACWALKRPFHVFIDPDTLPIPVERDTNP